MTRSRFQQRHPFPRLPEDFFREEAVEHYRERRTRAGDVIRIAPGWTRWFYWVLMIVFVGGLAFALIGTIDEYTEGAAIVQLEGQTALTARQAGVVAAIAVRPKQTVQAGQLLVRFHDAQEAAELERVRQEHDLQLVSWLRRPEDPAARQALAALQARVSHAEAWLAERSLRATHDGIVSDIRVRAGQSVAAGEAVLSLTHREAQAYVLAVLPGHSRPMLEPGMPLRLEITGYRYAYLDLRVDSVDDTVVGPAAIRRFLGQEIADTLVSQGPVVLARARLPQRFFDADGHSYPLHDGMHGIAQVRLRRERILFALVPKLKAASR